MADPAPIFTPVPRLPAALVLFAAMVLGAVYVGTWGRASGAEAATLSQLERQIADGNPGIDVWLAYAQRLYEANRAEDSAAAFARVLELDPLNRPARLGRSQALALTGDGSRLHTFIGEITLSDAKLAVEILDRRELAPFMAQETFQSLRADARAQAMD